MNSRSHVTIIGWINLVFGAFGVLGIGVMLIISMAVGMTPAWDEIRRELRAEGANPEVVGAVVVAVLGFVLLIMVALTAAQIFVGIGLLKHKQWGRILAIIVGIMFLPSFPLGTALGVYTMVVMFDDNTKKLFATPQAGHDVKL